MTALAKEKPEDALVHRQMGLYYVSRGRMAEAEKSLVRALELRPDSQEILRDLVLFYIREKQAAAAIQRINATPDDKKQAFHYELLGLVHSQAGNFADSEKAYKKAIEKDASHTNSETYLFADYIRRGRVDDGLQLLNEMIKKNPSNSTALTVRGALYDSQGKIEEARKSYTQALTIDANIEVAANNLAYIVAEGGGDLQSALGWAQSARKKQPENPDIADTLGWIYYKVGNYVLARDQLQFAVSKQPGNGIFQYHLGMIYKQTNQIGQAQAAFRKAADSSQNFKEKALAQAALKEIETKK